MREDVPCRMNNPDTPTAARIREVSAVFAGRPGTGIRGPEDFTCLLRLELGHEEALDRPVKIGGSWQRALAPRMIYHVCASNLAVSAETALALGLVLGSELVFKLPSSGLGDLVALVESLPAPLRGRVRLLAARDPAIMSRADAVVVFGAQEAVEVFRREVRWDQRFMAYGPKISLGWILPGSASAEWALAAAGEIRAFGQRGCLSPQSYLCADRAEAELFGGLLAAALSGDVAEPGQDATAEERALVREARQRARVRGDTVLEAEQFPGWTVVIRDEARIEPGPGCGFVEILSSQDAGVLEGWKGWVSSVSITADRLPGELLELFSGCGISRVCRMGELQNPPLDWRHDGQPRLAPLVRWIACDPGLEVG